MAYIATNYANNPKAPLGQWTCAPTSSLGPFTTVPSADDAKAPNYCGQCVSFVKQVCPELPSTSAWTKGAAVKDSATLRPGTVIATFDKKGKYTGHAAVYVSQDALGIRVYDQFVTPPNPSPAGPRTIRWGGQGMVNDGNNYYVVD